MHLRPCQHRARTARAGQPGVHRPAVTIIECVLATVILGISIVAGLNAAAAAAAANRAAGQRLLASGLATELLERIQTLQYAQASTNSIGPDAGETTPSQFNDVDDYNGWTESPPKTAAGVSIAGMDGWSRSVAVAWVQPLAINTVSATETSLKRVAVTVSIGGKPVSTAVTLRGDVP